MQAAAAVRAVRAGELDALAVPVGPRDVLAQQCVAIAAAGEIGVEELFAIVRGAYASKGGKSFICLSSTYEKRGERRSRIVFNLTPGNIVTTPRSDVMYVVTEFGMVNLKGRSVVERARALISIAHPDFREQLEREAYENRLVPRGVLLSVGAGN